MAFTTRFCTNLPSLLAAVLLTVACRGDPVEFGFHIDQVIVRPAPQAVQVRLDQDLRLSWESRNAMLHGVPLVLSLALEVRGPSSREQRASREQRFEIRYLPLSQRYELTEAGTGQVRTFPRLRHVINALARLNTRLDTGPLAPGDYELRARMKLEQGSLPMPMQLPVLISGKWRHDSDWSSWPFKINA